MITVKNARRFVLLLLCLACLQGSFAMASDQMVEVAQGGALSLWLDEGTLEFAVVDARSGKRWTSGSTLFRLTAQLDGVEKTYDAYTNCAALHQYEITAIENGVRIQMTVGEVKKITALDLPQAVEKEHFEQDILALLSADDKEQMLKRYTLYSVHDAALTGRKLDAALEAYPILQQRDLYLINSGVPDFAAERIKAILDGIGYDESRIQQDNDNNGVQITVAATDRYEVVLSLTLQDGSLLAVLDTSALHDAALRRVTDVTFLPLFGASTASADEGFFLLPDGSGALQDISGKKAGYSSASIRIYGRDEAISQQQVFNKTELAVLPVFGQSMQDGGFVAVIEKGDAIASVTTLLKGTANGTSAIYPTFRVVENAYVDAGFADAAASVNISMMQPDSYKGDLAVRYIFLAGEENTLHGMSSAVRNNLQTRGLLPTEKTTVDTALCVQLIGSVDRAVSLLGFIPSRSQVAATTFSQAQAIVQALHERGVGAINLQYEGWCNGGLYTRQLQSVQTESILGGEKGLQALNSWLLQQGDVLYPSVELSSVKNLQGLNTRQLAARALGNTLTTLYAYDVATGNALTGRVGTYIAPAQLSAYAADFEKSYQKLGIDALAVADTGKLLYSEMNKAAGLNRQRTEALASEMLDSLPQSNLMITGGNLYALQNATWVADIPVDSSRYAREEYAVPFVQMVLRGLVPYSAPAANNSGDAQEMLLRAIGYGARATFLGTYQPDTVFEGTGFNQFISTHYATWLDTAVAYALRAQEDLNAMGDADIISYRQLAEQVFETVFENGVSVVVNYGSIEAVVEGLRIPPRDWVRREVQP